VCLSVSRSSIEERSDDDAEEFCFFVVDCGKSVFHGFFWFRCWLGVFRVDGEVYFEVCVHVCGLEDV